MVSDITERKQAEVELTRLAAIVESSPDAILSTDADGRIVSWNSAAERLCGYTEDEVRGRFVWSLTGAGASVDPAEVNRLLLNGGERRAFRATALHKDGSLFEVEPSVSAIRDETGAVTGALAIVRAVS
jgi:PAS domain S-box-containing protein